jgi:hypothetical protein
METATQHICHCEKPARRDGAGQLQRYLKALDPSFVSIDGREMEDLLVFAKRYASQIRFHQFPHEQNEELEKSWRDFFRYDLSVLASSIATVDLAQIQKDFTEIREKLERLCNQESADNYALLEAYKCLFDPIMGIAKRIDRWYSVTLAEHLIRQDLDLLIQSVLAYHLAKGTHYAQTFAEVNKGKTLNLHLEQLENQHVWQIVGLQIDKITKPFEDDESIYEGDNLAEQLRHASFFVEDIFNAFFQGISKIVNHGEFYLQNSLEKYPAHQPQMALFIAFLELFRLAQNQLNGLTERHLQFYYRDVLRLQEKPAQPDKVFVVFELAKNVAEHHLAPNTAVSAGKDKAGKDLQYGLVKDFVVHQAKVVDLKTMFLDRNYVYDTKNNIDKSKTIINNIYANPIAKSADGKGLDFKGKNRTFQTFGAFNRKQKKPSSPDLCGVITPNIEIKNPAKIGFAIASPQLVLGGGRRLFRINIPEIKKLISNKNRLEIRLSGEKGWISLEKNDAIQTQKILGAFGSQFPTEDTPSGYFFDGEQSLFVYLPIKEQAIIAFDNKVHTGSNFNTKFPVMEVLIESFEGNLDALKDLKTSELGIEVQVGSIVSEGSHLHEGLTKLLAYNDQEQILDVSKAFDPFGFQPSEDSSWLIGSEEIFNKPLKTISLQIDNRSGGLSQRNFEVSVLDNRNWNIIDKTFSRTELSNISLDFARNEVIDIKSWFQGLEKGFIKLQNRVIPPPPIGLIGESIIISASEIFELGQSFKTSRLSVSYHSNLEKLDSNIDQFFHIYPFGNAEIGGKRNAINTDKLLPNFTVESLAFDSLNDALFSKNKIDKTQGKKAIQTKMLLTVLDYEKLTGEQDLRNQYSSDIQEEGHLFIGLENLKPLESLSLLFNFAEGSAIDEDNDPPKINWSYLTKNEWRPLRDERITSDSTFGFRTTGIMTFDIPDDITDNNTLIFTEKPTAWLCASVTQYSDRFPQLIDIVAQATEVQLIDNQNDASHFDEPLKAETINSLVIKTANIQAVKQPFASFEGKAPEVGKPFYTRVSERLRHKARAITAWDYEHLVLNQYPNVFKVKCVQHTDPNCLCPEPLKIAQDADGGTRQTFICCDSQIAPGHVMIVPIPNLKNREEVNPLMPRNSRRTLVSIEEYLKKRTSPFVHVHARNPVYEPILTIFKVQFYAGLDKGYYLKILNDDLVKYLSPWAFNEEVDVSFDNKIYASSIINFIEERPYVDFITDFRMIHCDKECCPPVAKIIKEGKSKEKQGNTIPDVEDCDEWEEFLTENLLPVDGEFAAIPSTARSILTSVKQHLISIYEANERLSPCEKKVKVIEGKPLL